MELRERKRIATRQRGKLYHGNTEVHPETSMKRSAITHEKVPEKRPQASLTESSAPSSKTKAALLPRTTHTTGAEIVQRIASSPLQPPRRDYSEEEIEALTKQDELTPEKRRKAHQILSDLPAT
jgi:hypothetical protein